MRPVIALVVALAASGCEERAPQMVAGASGAAGTAGMSGAAGKAADCEELAAPSPWPSWAMPNPVASQLPNPMSYAPSQSGSQVTDTVTGLVWERQVSAAPLDWEGAKQYCACLELDGNGDWRLPTRIELASLVDWASAAPSIDALAFPATPTENFWTSSLVETSPGLVYLVYFDNGHTTYSESDFEYRTRCVRSTPAPATERYELAAGSVRDTQTQLTWQQPAPKDELTWADAAAYCDALELDGSGWRLPSIGELQTLVDETRNPAVDAAAFPQTPSEYFWASSTVFGEPTRAWTTFFTNGSTYPFAQTALKNLRCVR